MLKKAFPFICRLFPHRIAKTYLHPLAHSRRSLRPYDAKSFFESYYSLPNQEKCFPDERVSILNMDVENAAPLPASVDLINAVGVMFHLVDDAQLQRVLARLSSVLRPGGVLVISGLFGWINQNTQFHRQDNFSSWAETRALLRPRASLGRQARSLNLLLAAAPEPPGPEGCPRATPSPCPARPREQHPVRHSPRLT